MPILITWARGNVRANELEDALRQMCEHPRYCNNSKVWYLVWYVDNISVATDCYCPCTLNGELNGRLIANSDRNHEKIPVLIGNHTACAFCNNGSVQTSSVQTGNQPLQQQCEHCDRVL